MAGVGVSVKVDNFKEIKTILDEMPEKYFAGAKKAFQKFALKADRKVKQNAKNNLHVRTGALRDSIKQKVTGGDLNTLRASVFTTSKYAPVQEFGTKDKPIKAKAGGALTIPMQENKYPSGVTKKPVREVFNEGGFISYGIIWLEDVPMFLLVKQVKIPPRFGMIKAVEGEATNLMFELKDIVL